MNVMNWKVALGLGLFGLGSCLAFACTNAAPAKGEGGAAGAGTGAGTGLGGANSLGGSSANSGGTSTGGASTVGAGMGTGGGASGKPCSVVLTANTSDAINADLALEQACQAFQFDGQMNFEVTQGVDPDIRNLNIDFFAPRTAGASFKIEDGNDFALGKGGNASYIDNAGVWIADSGTITLVSITEKTYVVSISQVHFVVGGNGTNKGEFTANGTITGTVK